MAGKAKAQFDPAELAAVVDQWITGACERLDVMIDGDASVIDIRDAALFLSGCLCGSLQMLGIPIATVNQKVADFQTSLDGHLLERLPQHPASVWDHNIPQLLQ
jgi:hypothetical protein